MNSAAKLIWWGMALACAALLIAALTTKPVRGHDMAHPELDDWYRGLRSPGGGPCCGGPKVDATTLNDTQWRSKDGHYSALVNGEWLEVPDENVVMGANIAGHTLVWLGFRDGKPFVRCFMPGAMI